MWINLMTWHRNGAKVCENFEQQQNPNMQRKHEYGNMFYIYLFSHFVLNKSHGCRINFYDYHQQSTVYCIFFSTCVCVRFSIAFSVRFLSIKFVLSLSMMIGYVKRTNHKLNIQWKLKWNWKVCCVCFLFRQRP